MYFLRANMHIQIYIYAIFFGQSTIKKEIHLWVSFFIIMMNELIRFYKKLCCEQVTAFGGERVMNLLRFIERSYRRFKRPPIGPIGAHLVNTMKFMLYHVFFACLFVWLNVNEIIIDDLYYKHEKELFDASIISYSILCK